MGEIVLFDTDLVRTMQSELCKYCLLKLNVLAAKSSFSFPFSLPPVGGGGGGGEKGKEKLDFFA